MKVSDISVQYVDHMGSDLSVVNAARVSFDKIADNYTTEQNTKLIKYLAKHKHYSPFNHTFLTFRIKAPIFVARQLVKHKFMPWNEISRRYVDSEPEFYIPTSFRKRAENVKQGSGAEYAGAANSHQQLILKIASEDSLATYNKLLRNGVCPEQARMILPQNTMTEWFWSGTLGAFADMLRLRLDPHTPYESRLVAEKILDLIHPHFPISIEALLNESK